MNLNFQSARAQFFKGPTPIIKNLSEHWVSQHVYCPNCGHVDLTCYPPNRPVADFFCSGCHEEYELKALGRVFGPKVGDGAYRTMIERLASSTNPSLLLLHYDPAGLSVLNLMVIPKYFFVPQIIERRKPLAMTAKRADLGSKGWLLSTMRCIEKLGSSTFTLLQCYEFEDELRAAHPSNQHVKEKIRQKLQVLRDKGCLQFLGRGTYRVVKAPVIEQ